MSLPLVFAAGLVSFISPCVLPLVPGYVSTISGVSFEQLGERGRGVNRQVAGASALFFVGFLAVFVALGASASVVGTFLIGERTWLNRIAGGLIVLFGLSMLGLGWSGALGGRWTNAVQAIARRRGGPVALGVAFAFCWTPCVGPILASILALAGASGSLQSGVLLLLVYGLGLAVPFLAIGFGFTRLIGGFRGVGRHYRGIEALAGALLITMGVLLLSGYLFVLKHLRAARAELAAPLLVDEPLTSPPPATDVEPERSPWLTMLKYGASALVVGLLALLVWATLAAGRGENLVQQITKGTRPPAPAFALGVLWPHTETWSRDAAAALADSRLSLSELRGHPVVLNFWASWCVACRAEAHVLHDAARAHRAQCFSLGSTSRT